MKSKRIGVAKVVALAAVPLVLAGILAKVSQERRVQTAQVATRNTVGSWASCLWGGPSIAKMIDQSADVNARDAQGNTSLHIAARLDPALIPLLLSRGAHPDAQNAKGETALVIAAGRGDAEGVRSLLRRRAKVNLRSAYGRTALSAVQSDLRNLRGLRTIAGGNFEAQRYLTSYIEIFYLLKAAGAKE